jgi:hypothetical protein
MEEIKKLMSEMCPAAFPISQPLKVLATEQPPFCFA